MEGYVCFSPRLFGDKIDGVSFFFFAECISISAVLYVFSQLLLTSLELRCIETFLGAYCFLKGKNFQSRLTLCISAFTGAGPCSNVLEILFFFLNRKNNFFKSLIADLSEAGSGRISLPALLLFYFL